MKTIKLNCNYLNKLISVCLTYNEDQTNIFYNKDEIDNLITFKNKIDTVSSQKIWDNTKKLTNDYELIHLPNRKLKSERVLLNMNL